MKKISLFLLLILFAMGIMGQKAAITLTFTSVYYQGGYVPLDSIRVSNNTQGMDTVLYYPDTVLVLESTVGIDRNKLKAKGFGVLQNFPNPVTGQTRITVFIPEQDRVGIIVTDAGGRTLLRSDWQLERGYHTFSFTPGETGLLFFMAIWRGIHSTVKILSESAGNPGNAIAYAGFEDTELRLKSNEQSLGFVFNLGDSLIYTGYAITTAAISGSDVIEDRPLRDSTYLFEIVEGIPCQGMPVLNYGSQIYNTVQIGTQCWMAQNLNIGTRINGSQNQTNNSIIEKYCYNDLESNCDVYGALYQWDEAMQYVTAERVKGICPSGWHIPTDGEWTVLSTNLGGQSAAGGKIKETGLVHWESPNTGATNSSGFTALGAGYRGINPIGFYELKVDVNIWTSTQSTTYPGTAWMRYVYNYQHILISSLSNKPDGYSLRCIKD
jgi:uncharacterized protein (TIGR02145 family)